LPIFQTAPKPNAESAECEQTLPVDDFLLPDDASAAKGAFISFRKVLLDGDKKQVADMVFLCTLSCEKAGR
jgi:hypothetical protein